MLCYHDVIEALLETKISCFGYEGSEGEGDFLKFRIFCLLRSRREINGDRGQMS